MTNSITPPNFHEDQPSAEEVSLSQLIGAHNPMGAAAMLIPEMQRRDMAQDDYHAQLANINDIQRQNILANQQEAGIKSFVEAAQHDPGGLLASLRTVPGLSGLIPDAANSQQLEQGIATRNAAANLAQTGKGVEGLGIAGVTVPGNLLPPGSVQGPSIAEKAASINAASRVQAATIGATKGNQDTTTEVNPPGSGGTIVNPVTYKYRGAPHGLSIPSAPGATAAPSYSPDVINQAATRLHAIDPTAHADVLKGAASNGGTPKVGVRPDGKPGLMGASGKVY